MSRRLIETTFPLVQLNPLSRRERNAFKPIYKMHKWFARRSSSIFRAILLGAAYPATLPDGSAPELMEAFYRGHAHDPLLRRPDGAPLKVLDPFMGGGTTVVEALRLGLEVTGVDYNPVAWFIVRGETTPVDPGALQGAFERLADKVKEPLLELYRTPCPVSGLPADIIYGFWVKQGVCQNPACGGVTDLFKSYEVARKRGDASIKSYIDLPCPHCGQTFDWELQRCTVTAGGPQVAGPGAAGKGRPEGTAYAFAPVMDGVICPHCQRTVRPGELRRQPKLANKKVPLHVLLDPSSGDFFEVRGAIPEQVTAPKSGHTFAPLEGPVSGRGVFRCAHCGQQQKVVEAARAHDGPLPFRYYGLYAHTPHCAKGSPHAAAAEAAGLPTNNYKWFAPVGPGDLEQLARAEAELSRERAELPLPEQEIPEGRNFRDLLSHGYRRWSELYNPRQLLCLGRLLQAIAEEPDPALRDALLGAFQSHLDSVSNLTKYDFSRNMPSGVTSAHDYRNPTAIAENSVWGIGQGRGPFGNCFAKLVNGLEYRDTPDLTTESGKTSVDDVAANQWNAQILCQSAAALDFEPRSFDLVITDPPYAGSVQYAEMSDWYYVWLHQVLRQHYPEFEPEITLKGQEIIEDTRDKDMAWYFAELTEAWKECHRVLRDEGLLVFTFHHERDDRWVGLLQSLFDAGFYLTAAYPVHSEALNSIVIQSTKGITYDIIHVCRKRPEGSTAITWPTLRREVKAAAAAKLRELEAGGDVLPGPDVWMILLGKALELFSRHWGRVLDREEQPLRLEEGLARLRVLVREVRGETRPLPPLLAAADGLSQIYFLHVLGKEGWPRDGLHIELRGYALSPDDLIKAGLVEEPQKGSLRPVPPLVRAEQQALAPGATAVVDRLHLLLATLERGKDPLPLLRLWFEGRETLAEGLRLVSRAEAELRPLCGVALRLIEALRPEDAPDPGGQLRLFNGEEG